MIKLDIKVPNQRDFWDRWHEKHAVASHTAHADHALKTFVGALPPPSSASSVLEVGCGQGRESIELSRQGFRVHGFDHSPLAISTALAAAHTHGEEIDFTQHDALEPFPYQDRQFDGVFAHLSLHYFDDHETQGVFQEIWRVLKPGAPIYFTVRSTSDPLCGRGQEVGTNMYCLNGHLRRFLSLDYLNELLSEWRIELLEPYSTRGTTTNPGEFIRGLCMRC